MTRTHLSADLPADLPAPGVSLAASHTTAEWQQLDARHYLHPFTDFKGLAAEGSRIIVRAEGPYLWDSEGNRILDGMAGLWCASLGFSEGRLADAAQRREALLHAVLG